VLSPNLSFQQAKESGLTITISVATTSQQYFGDLSLVQACTWCYFKTKSFILFTFIIFSGSPLVLKCYILFQLQDDKIFVGEIHELNIRSLLNIWSQEESDCFSTVASQKKTALNYL
jgi:hypothetical protein